MSIRVYKVHRRNPKEVFNQPKLTDFPQQALLPLGPHWDWTKNQRKWVQLLSLASALYLSSQRSPFCHFEKTLHFKLKKTGPSLSTSSRRGADASLTTSSQLKDTKLRYQDWLFAGGEDPEEKSFIILWVPKALEAIKDPNKDTHPRAQCLGLDQD